MLELLFLQKLLVHVRANVLLGEGGEVLLVPAIVGVAPPFAVVKGAQDLSDSVFVCLGDEGIEILVVVCQTESPEVVAQILPSVVFDVTSFFFYRDGVATEEVLAEDSEALDGVLKGILVSEEVESTRVSIGTEAVEVGGDKAFSDAVNQVPLREDVQEPPEEILGLCYVECDWDQYRRKTE